MYSTCNVVLCDRVQILQLRIPLLFGNADLHQPEARRRPGDVHQQRSVLRHHPGVRAGPGQTANQSNGQGKNRLRHSSKRA